MSEALNHKGIWTDEASKALSEAANRSMHVAKEYPNLYGVTNNIANINTLLVPQAELESLRAERDALKADAERYRWLTKNAYVGIAPHPKPHEVWCLRLPNPGDCNSLDAAIDAAKEQQR